MLLKWTDVKILLQKRLPEYKNFGLRLAVGSLATLMLIGNERKEEN